MPRHDTISPKLDRAALAWARYKRLTSWMAIAAVVAVLLALIYLKSEGRPVPFHMMIATVAGVGLTVLLGTALMGLVFLGNASSHDEGAHRSNTSMGTRDDAASGKEEFDDQR
ncbi:hypothetical protein [Sphingosinicella humi]|uniref:hypothetical protein n=1 Tax=Allosphingosinicella humi TaxID=2068657 RepID=UPI001A9C7B7A|nr:hypothetical protein [Sphingosinicella humi]